MISIIVPVYNVEDVCRACIDSILSQSFEDFELILVNDGSFDGSGIVCDEYLAVDQRIQVIHQSNSGVSSARNKGILYSIGEYLCFVDSDDIISPDYLYKLYEIMKEHSDLAICGFNWMSGNNVINQTLYRGDLFCYADKAEVMNYLDLLSAPWAKMFRADIIKNKSLLFPEDISYGEDLLFNFKYVDNIERIAICNQPLYKYYVDNQNSLLRRYRPELLECFERINAYIEYYIKKWRADNSQIQSLVNKRYYDYENVMRNTFSSENRDGIRKKLAYNRQILKSHVFQLILRQTNAKINNIYRLAYKLHSYSIIFVYGRIVSIIKKER